MRIKKGFVLREVCGERIITAEGLGVIDFGKMLALNESAAWLWKEAVDMGDFTVDSLAARLCEEYDVAADEARRDVEDFTNQWRDVGVLEDTDDNPAR